MPANISYIVRVIMIVLLLGCLARMPYGYYQFVRLSTMTVFLFLAYQAYEKKHLILMIFCLGVAIVFNPIVKIYFSRGVWNKIDVALAVAIIIWIITDLLKHGEGKTNV